MKIWQNNHVEILYKFKFCPCVDDYGNINENELEEYVRRFLKEIDESGYELIGRQILGDCFAHSPSKDEFPIESVCKVFEKYYTEEIGKGFVRGIKNSRGIHTLSDGNDSKHWIQLILAPTIVGNTVYQI